MASTLVIVAAVIEPNGERTIRTTGQTAKALRELVSRGAAGLTALEADTWAFRLAAYCHDLRRKHGLAIETVREVHPGGWHGRHVLRTPVRIVYSNEEQ